MGNLGTFLNLETNVYDIVKWNDSQIIYVDDFPQCVSYIYTIDRLTKQVNGIRKPKKGADANLCESIEKRDMRLKLVDGLVVWKQERNKVENAPRNIAVLVLLLLAYIVSLIFVWKRGLH